MRKWSGISVGLAALFVIGLGPAQGSKKVVIDKTSQTLRGYEDGRLVFKTPVSTGKSGKETPNGSFRARSKKRMHYSSLYNNAPMPFSVNIGGNYFIHGYSSVPPHPASHGCIRVPLGGKGNPAEFFYNWVDTGTPVRITGHWQGGRRGR